MDRQKVMELFNKKPRIGTLSTSNQKGDVNVAVFGSPQMVDENTVVMGIGKNRSYQNLKENPKAVFIVMKPGKSVAEWQGYRIYLKALAIENKGELLDQIKETLLKVAGKGAANMIYAAVRFEITEVRALLAPA